MDNQQELKLYFSKNKSRASLIIYGMLFVFLIPVLIPLLKNLYTSIHDFFDISYNSYLLIYEFLLTFLVSATLLYRTFYRYLNKSPQITINKEGVQFKDNSVIPWWSIEEVTIESMSRRTYFSGPMYTGNVLCVITKGNSREYSVFLDYLDDYAEIGKVVSNYEKKFNDSTATMYGEPLKEKQKESDKDMNSFFMGSFKLMLFIIGPIILSIFAIYGYLLYNLK
jgi:hypothetical protein